MMLQKNLVTGALALASAVGLVACGGGDKGTQDVGSNNAPTPLRTVAARAVDGYLAGATVYVDQNGNGKLDAFEPRAITDVNGYFSYNHATKTDYCAAGAAQSLAKYCLQVSATADAELTIRVAGGYDTVTGMPFEGTLSLRSKDLDSNDLRLVTPLTSMVADSLTTEQKFQALVEAGVFAPLNDDYIAGNDGSTATRAQIATILARIMGQATDVGTGYTFKDIESGTWINSYAVMAQQLLAPGVIDSTTSGSFESPFQTPEQLMALARKLAYGFMSPGESMPSGFQLEYDNAARTMLSPLADFARFSEKLAERLAQMPATSADIAAVLRLQSITATRISQDATDPAIRNLIAWGENQLAQGNGLGSDLSRLGGDDIDASALLDPRIDFDPASNSISASATIPPQVAQLFSSLFNTSFQVSVNDADKQGAALVFFEGQSGATSGELGICVRYSDISGDFDTGSAGDPNGALLVNGNWSLIDGHTLMLDVEIAGGVRPLVLKAVGANGADREYRFDFGGDLSKWTGTPPAFFTAGTVPTDDASCKAALIGRFGSAS